MKPGVENSNYSTETKSPGDITCKSLLQLSVDLILKGIIFVASYRHHAHLGVITVCGRLGRTPRAVRGRSLFEGNFHMLYF